MKVRRLLYFVILLALVSSCKPQVPDKYLQPDEFEDILYDYHLADAMANNSDNANEISYNMTLYRQTVLRKYGITQAEFDSSLVYYTRHADRLHLIYENISKRLEEDAMSLGASANDVRNFGTMTSSRDTSNLWRGVPATLLMPKAPYNVLSFEITADSTYREGDKMIFSFNCDFVYSDGFKDATAMLAVQFKNDSIASNTVKMSSNTNYSISVNDSKNKGIKAIRGFIYLSDRKSFNKEDSRENELRLLFINNIRLVRLRTNAMSDDSSDGNGMQTHGDSLNRGSGRPSAGSTDGQYDATGSSADANTRDGRNRTAGDTKPKRFIPSRNITRQ